VQHVYDPDVECAFQLGMVLETTNSISTGQQETCYSPALACCANCCNSEDSND
jgi:hypothetical protein